MEVRFVVADCNMACDIPHCQRLHVSGWFLSHESGALFGPFESKEEAKAHAAENKGEPVPF